MEFPHRFSDGEPTETILREIHDDAVLRITRNIGIRNHLLETPRLHCALCRTDSTILVASGGVAVSAMSPIKVDDAVRHAWNALGIGEWCWRRAQQWNARVVAWALAMHSNPCAQPGLPPLDVLLIKRDAMAALQQCVHAHCTRAYYHAFD